MYTYTTRVSVLDDKSLAMLKISNNKVKIFELKNYSKNYSPELRYDSNWELISESDISANYGSAIPSNQSLERISEEILPYKRLVLAGHTEGDCVPAKIFHSYLSDHYRSVAYKICAYIEDSKLNETQVFSMASQVYDKLNFDA